MPFSKFDTSILLTEEIDFTFHNAEPYDIIVASAGFDEYEKDWGGKLSTTAYNEIGR